MGASMSLISGTHWFFALAVVAAVAFGEGSTPDYELAGPTDELPTYLQDMQDTMYRKRDEYNEARHFYKDAKAAAAAKKKHKEHKEPVEVDPTDPTAEDQHKAPPKAHPKVETETMGQDMIEASAKMQAKANAQAKAQFDKSMAHMKRLSEEFGRKAKEYEARSQQAAAD